MTISTSNVACSNGIDVFPYPIRFANDAAIYVNDTVRVTNGNPIINTGATSGVVLGNSSVTFQTVTVPAITVGGVMFGAPAGVINTQFFSANGFWTKPPNLTGDEQVLLMIWGTGGGAVSGANSIGGGGGGSCLIGSYPASFFVNSCIIQFGGSIQFFPGANTTSANNSIVFTVPTGGSANASFAGGGGGILGGFALNGSGDGGKPLGGLTGSPGGDSEFGGGGGGITSSSGGGSSIFGGGGGGGLTGNGGNSIYGGGGGSNSGIIGTSVFGGNGGNNSISATNPGGGGAKGAGVSITQGAIRVWVIK